MSFKCGSMATRLRPSISPEYRRRIQQRREMALSFRASVLMAHCSSRVLGARLLRVAAERNPDSDRPGRVRGEAAQACRSAGGDKRRAGGGVIAVCCDTLPAPIGLRLRFRDATKRAYVDIRPDGYELPTRRHRERRCGAVPRGVPGPDSGHRQRLYRMATLCSASYRRC
jgi:hypothetical protein